MFQQIYFQCSEIEKKEQVTSLFSYKNAEQSQNTPETIPSHRSSSLKSSLRRLRNSSFSIREQEKINQEIFLETLAYLKKQVFPLFTTKVSTAKFPIKEEKETVNFKKVKLVNTTTFQMTQELISQGYKPLVLNMANRSSPGGSVLKGAGAQEETLCRQSNLYLALKEAQAKGDYPFVEFGGILVRNVTFFRNDFYEFLDVPFQVDILAIAAYDCNPDHVPYGELSGYDCPSSAKDYEFGTKAKIRTIFQTALENGNDSLVLGAFGCGAFKNDPVQIAIWYQEVLREIPFQNAFKTITFAITGQKNFEAFASVFHML